MGCDYTIGGQGARMTLELEVVHDGLERAHQLMDPSGAARCRIHLNIAFPDSALLNLRKPPIH